MHPNPVKQPNLIRSSEDHGNWDTIGVITEAPRMPSVVGKAVSTGQQDPEQHSARE
jgi:hypothetical protein